MAESSSSSSSGIGCGSFLLLLGLLFIALKLTHVIDWQWWIVLLPIYPAFVIFAIVAIVMGGIMVAYLGASVWDKYDERKRKKARENQP